MHIHSYQAQELLSSYGIPVPRGGLAYSADQAAYRAREIGGDIWVVKAQAHAYSNTSGEIQYCESERSVWLAADGMLGERVVTPTSGEKGVPVKRVYVEAAIKMLKHIELRFALDPKNESAIVVASLQSTMNIECAGGAKPSSSVSIEIEPAVGLLAFQARELAFRLGLTGKQIHHFVDVAMVSYRALTSLDASELMIGCLAVTYDGMVACDVSISLDDNAHFRQARFTVLRDRAQEHLIHARAKDMGFSHIGLGGNIGCLVNDAGLAMATMDMINCAGGESADFLDIGWDAASNRIRRAFRIVTSNQNTRVVLVNVFAGINRCDLVAEGILYALEEDQNKLPLVIRLSGNRAKEGQCILASSAHEIVLADTIAEAAKAAVQAGKA